MKRIYLFSALLFCVGVMVVFSCKKKTEEPSYDVSHLNEMFEGLRSTPQQLTVQAGRDTTVFGADSTLLHFYPNSFKDASGNIIGSGAILIKLVEMYKPGIMAANRASTTTTDGKLLRSGGQANIQVTMNGKEVFANKYAIGFKQPGSSTQPMSLYYGGNGNADSVVNWTMSDPSIAGANVLSTISDTSTSKGFNFGGGFYYLFTGCTQFRYVNCDYLNNNTGQGTNIAVVVPDNSYNPANTQIFIILPGINAITSSDVDQDYDASSNTFIPGNHDNRIPIGVEYKVVVIACKDKAFYYYENSGTSTEGMVIHAAMAPETQGDIKIRLAGL